MWSGITRWLFFVFCGAVWAAVVVRFAAPVDWQNFLDRAGPGSAPGILILVVFGAIFAFAVYLIIRGLRMMR